MEASEYLAVLRKQWAMIALLAGVGLAAGYGYSSTVPPSYRATSSVYVSLQQGESVSELLQGTTYAQNLVQSYAQLATMPIVLDPVIDRLDLDTTPTELSRSITATSPLNTSILQVSAVGGSADGAARLSNAVSDELATAVRRLSSRSDTGRSAVSLSTVAEATPPPFAFAPNTKVITAAGGLAGAALGVVLALARTVLDTRVRGVKDVRRVTDAAVLTTVRYDRRVSRALIAMRDDPQGDQAEAYRRLRTNLRFLNIAGTNRALVVTSPLPAEGKSTTSINLAIAMSEGGARVLLVDADLRRPSIARYLAIEGAAGLTTVLIGEADAQEVIQPWGPGSLDVLAAGQVPPNPSELLDSPAMAALLDRLRNEYDVVLLDSPPLLPVTDSAVLSRLTDGALVVVSCRTSHRQQLAGALHAVEAVGARVLGLVLNQAPPSEAGSTYVYGSVRPTRARPWRRRTAPPPAAEPLRPSRREQRQRRAATGEDTPMSLDRAERSAGPVPEKAGKSGKTRGSTAPRS